MHPSVWEASWMWCECASSESTDLHLLHIQNVSFFFVCAISDYDTDSIDCQKLFSSVPFPPDLEPSLSLKHDWWLDANSGAPNFSFTVENHVIFLSGKNPISLFCYVLACCSVLFFLCDSDPWFLFVPLGQTSISSRDREERVRKIREQQEDERRRKLDELKQHVRTNCQFL